MKHSMQLQKNATRPWKARSWLVLIFGLFAACAALGAPAASSAKPHTTVWDQWITSLKSNGFTVTQGIAALHDCPTYIAVFGNCSGNNPSGGYYDILPPIDDTYVDPCYNPAHDCSGNTPSSYTVLATLPDGSHANVNQFYRLGASDALVVIVNLPPLAAYFGYQSYLYSRPNSVYSIPDCSTPGTAFPDPCRTPTRGSIGNSINLVEIKDRSGLTLSSGGTIAFITTSNQALYRQLATQFQHVGGVVSNLFAEPVAQNIVAGPYNASVNPGTDISADEMNTLLRYTLPQDQSAVDGWEAALTSNVQVFRVRNATITPQRYARSVLAPRHYATDETTYQAAVDELTADLQVWLQTLTTAKVKVAAMGSYIKISPKTGLPAVSLGLDYVGPFCIAKGNDCLRDTQDTDSYRGRSLSKSLDHTAAVVGVDSTQTGNATYIGVGVTDYSILQGVDSLSQTNPQVTGFSSGALTGSASDLVSDLVTAGLIPPPSPTLAAALPKLFVALVTRACPTGATAFYCAKPYTMNVDETQIPLTDEAQVTRRTYVLPGDIVGPNPNYIFPTQVVY